jgi:simple sugar transport system permease protein
MVPQFPTGYGFTAIIVAFLGRLHPIGIVILGGLVLAVTYVGGETAQSTLGLPSAATGVFQAMLLFLLLATDVLINYRLRLRSRAGAAS